MRLGAIVCNRTQPLRNRPKTVCEGPNGCSAAAPQLRRWLRMVADGAIPLEQHSVEEPSP